MRGQSLSVVMPFFNEREYLGPTLAALVDAVELSGFDAELVLVDDGSTDGGLDVARSSTDGRLPLRVVTQEQNRGRFEARRAGLAAADRDYVLLLDARVRLEPGALRFVREHLPAAPVWNGHVHIVAADDLGNFWRLLAELAWRDYFDAPHTTSFGSENFDRFPKGTGCFLAPRALLESAFAGFRSNYSDARLANDDTPILRAVAAQQAIHISPEFACIYEPRTNARSFFRHAVHRGVVFVDGHGTPQSRFFPAVVAFFPLSAALAVASVRRPSLLALALGGCGAAAAAFGVAAGRRPRDVRTLALVTPLYAVGHAAGMWRGALELLR